MITDFTTRLMKERVLCLRLTSTQPVFQLTRSSFRWQSDNFLRTNVRSAKYSLLHQQYHYNTTRTIAQLSEGQRCWVSAWGSKLGFQREVSSLCFIEYISLYIFIMNYIMYIIIYSLARCIHIFDQTLMILLIAGGPLSLKDSVQQALETRVRSTRGKE